MAVVEGSRRALAALFEVTLSLSLRFWPSSAIEAARNRPNKLSNPTVNDKGPALGQIRRVSKMERHDLKSESETVAGSFEVQLHRFQQLNEYCDQAVAEIRASLEHTQNESN